MAMDKNVAVLLLIALASAFSSASDSEGKEDPFTYDYHRLRVGGLIFAGVLCAVGIIILLSGHCRCKFKQNKRQRNRNSPPGQQLLSSPAHASEC
ncbi:FXYD domain-containing ion transport regulator 3-like [Erpetoichthys calabaricus]|uniref:FXYD domain-containing ion transport regulator n=2 Tax=Polypteridae TaxID=8289 RepID=A0A8C4T9W7_ERPCA